MSRARNESAAPATHTQLHKRVGFFAGAFDPIHDGHVAVAESAVQLLGLEKLYFMVERQPWTDKQPIASEHREAMVRLATDKIATLSQLKTSQIRFGITHTLPEIERQFPDHELYFVFGADVFLRMNSTQWPSLSQLFKHYIVVFERGELTEADITAHAKSLGIVTAIIPSAHPHHRSTDIRLRSHEKSVWVPEAVAAYIDEHGLYSVAVSDSE